MCFIVLVSTNSFIEPTLLCIPSVICAFVISQYVASESISIYWDGIREKK